MVRPRRRCGCGSYRGHHQGKAPGWDLGKILGLNMGGKWPEWIWRRSRGLVRPGYTEKYFMFVRIIWPPVGLI